MSLGANWCEIGIEIDGQQILHLIAFEKYAAIHKKYPHLAKQVSQDGVRVKREGIRSKGSGDKLWRMHLVSPDFIDGKTFFNKEKRHTADMAVLLSEIKMTTAMEIKSPTDDGLDCLSQKALIDWYPPFTPAEAISEYNDVAFDEVYSSNNSDNSVINGAGYFT
jgi:hypothetical protein